MRILLVFLSTFLLTSTAFCDTGPNQGVPRDFLASLNAFFECNHTRDRCHEDCGFEANEYCDEDLCGPNYIDVEQAYWGCIDDCNSAREECVAIVRGGR